MAIRKPTKLKMPKKPKSSASISAWEKYDERCKTVEKKNAEKLREYTKQVNAIKAAKKKKELLIKKYKA